MTGKGRAMAKGDDIREKLVGFGVGIINFCGKLPSSPAGTHISGQLLRCATSAAPNYAEARGAESAKDFVHKLGVVLKEMNEAEVWLDMIQRAQLMKSEELSRLQADCKSLCRILGASVRTAGRNLSRLRHDQE